MKTPDIRDHTISMLRRRARFGAYSVAGWFSARVPALTAGRAIHDRSLLQAVNSGVRLNDPPEKIHVWLNKRLAQKIVSVPTSRRQFW